MKEFGFKLHEMCNERNHNQSALRGLLIELYSASGANHSLGSSVYADRQKNLGEVLMPAFSLLCESTPSTFYENLNENLIAQGLVSRLLIVEYCGPRVAANQNRITIADASLLNALANMSSIWHTLMQSNQVVPVKWSGDSQELSDIFNELCDMRIKKEFVRDIWNRANLNTLKLASQMAVFNCPSNPMIGSDDWVIAQEWVEGSVNNLVGRFEAGEVGPDSSGMRQSNSILRAMRKFNENEWNDVEKYCSESSSLLHRTGIVPYGYIQRTLVDTASFRNDEQNPTDAIKRTLRSLTESGIIREVGRDEIKIRGLGNYNGGAFEIIDMNIRRISS
jgi:hypothetical protein